MSGSGRTDEYCLEEAFRRIVHGRPVEGSVYRRHSGVLSRGVRWQRLQVSFSWYYPEQW